MQSYIDTLADKHIAENIIGSMYTCTCKTKEWMSLRELVQHLLGVGMTRGMEIA